MGTTVIPPEEKILYCKAEDINKKVVIYIQRYKLGKVITSNASCNNCIFCKNLVCNLHKDSPDFGTGRGINYCGYSI